MLDRLLDLRDGDRPDALGDPVSRLRVQVDRVEQRPPHVVLVLVERAVADPHRLRVLVAGQVRQDRLGQVALAAEPVHHLQVTAVLDPVGHELEEAVGLRVEPQRVEAPQRERRVSDPRVPVVPVALATRRLWERGRPRGHQRAGRRVHEALQRERAPLQVDAPGVIGELALVQPLTPVLLRPPHPVGGVLVVGRWLVVGPRERDEPLVPVLHRRGRVRASAFEPHPEVARQSQRQISGGDPRERVAVSLGLVLPGDLGARVIGRGLAVHQQLDVAVHAADRAEQDVLGLVVARRPLVLDRPLRVVVPGPDEQRVPDHEPPRPRLPRRLQDERPRHVPPPRRDRDVRRADAEMARRTVEHGREDRRAVGPGQAEPLDAAARRQQRLDLPVRQERVLRDRGERAPLREPHRALGDRHRADSSGTAKGPFLDRRQPRPPSRPPHPRARARSPAPRRPSRPGGTRSPREPAPERRRGRPRCAWAG